MRFPTGKAACPPRAFLSERLSLTTEATSLTGSPDGEPANHRFARINIAPTGIETKVLRADGGRKVIPDQLRDAPLIRLETKGKRPVVGPREVEPIEDIREWLGRGGNVGVSLSGELVVVDVDAGKLAEIADDVLPPTFTIATGGGGEHRYFRCAGWDANRKFGDLGSIRSEGWQVAAPPSIHPNGDPYQVTEDRAIERVEPARFEELIEEASDRPWYDSTAANTSRGGAPGVGGGGAGAGASLPAGYPDRSASWSTCKSWLQANRPIWLKFQKTTSSDWSGDEFAVAKCLAEGGFAVDTIRDALDRLHPNAKWHRGSDELSVEEYQGLTVQKAIEAAASDPYVDWEIAYKESSDSERRKNEPGESSPGNQPHEGRSAGGDKEYD